MDFTNTPSACSLLSLIALQETSSIDRSRNVLPSTVNEELYQIVRSGDVDNVKRLAAETPEELLKAKKNDKTVLHCAARMAYLKKIPKCVALFTILLEVDRKLSQEAGIPSIIDARDNSGNTALHYVAAFQNLELARMLVSKYNAKPDIKNCSGMLPLHVCIENSYNYEVVEDVECVKFFLNVTNIDHNALYKIRGVKMTLVHLAVESTEEYVLDLLLSRGLKPSQRNSEGYTPLMLAARKETQGFEQNKIKIVKLLLQSYVPEEINAASDSGKTPLMYAARGSYLMLLKTLLKNWHTDVYALDNRKRTVLHWAVDAYDKSKNLECVELIMRWESNKQTRQTRSIQNGLLYDMRDVAYESPVDIAIRIGSVPVVKAFLAVYNLEDWLDEARLTKVYATMAEAMLPTLSNSFMYRLPENRDDPLLECRFRAITGAGFIHNNHKRPETKYLIDIVDLPSGSRNALLTHSLMQTFLHMKWQRVSWMFWTSCIFQALFTLSYTFLVFEIFPPNCIDEMTATAQMKQNDTFLVSSKDNSAKLKLLLSIGFSNGTLSCPAHRTETQTILTFFLYITLVIPITIEFVQMAVTPRWDYFKRVANYGQWFTFMTAIANSITVWQALQINLWQVRIAALALLTVWLLTLREFVNFPGCGTYVLVLRKVFHKCLLLLTIFLPLLVAFSLCLRLLVPGKGQHNYVLLGIVKTIAVMAGDVNLDETFYDENGPSLDVSGILGEFVMIGLVIITSIVMLNVVTGFAVSDVQNLAQRAALGRLCDQVRIIHRIEVTIIRFRESILGFDKWSHWFSKMNVVPKCSSCSPDDTIVTLKSLPKDLQKKIGAELDLLKSD